MYVMIRT